jgi:hypothetical protein
VAGKFANDDVTVIEMLDQTRRDAMETNKTKPANYSLRAEMLSRNSSLPKPFCRVSSIV